MKFDVSIIKGKTVFDLVRAHREKCTQIIQQAYLAHAAGQSVNPDSYFLQFPDKPGCRIIALPAYLGHRFGVAGIKWIASFPANIHHGFPRASAVLVLNSYETGYPFAILESSIISAARTAASAALAADWLTGHALRAHSLGIVGTGFIARYVYDFLVDGGWAVHELQLHDLSLVEAEKFRNTACRPEHHRTITIVPDISRLIRACDVIVFTTRQGTHDLWAISPDGSNPRRLTSGGDNQGPTWAPNGRHLAFQSNRLGRWQVFAMLADGSAPAPLTRGQSESTSPTWSPRLP